MHQVLKETLFHWPYTFSCEYSCAPVLASYLTAPRKWVLYASILAYYRKFRISKKSRIWERRYLQRLVLHLFVVCCDLEFASLAWLLVDMLLSVTGIEEIVLLPVWLGFVEALHFVSQTCVLYLKLEHLVQIEVSWLKRHDGIHWILLVNLL